MISSGWKKSQELRNGNILELVSGISDVPNPLLAAAIAFTFLFLLLACVWWLSSESAKVVTVPLSSNQAREL